MASRRAFLLCEDKLHQVFMRRLLDRMDFDVFPQPLPGGNKGAAEQYVRREYPKMVRKWRSKSHDENLALVVVIDADNYHVHQRKNQLDEQLQNSGEQRRAQGENIAVFVPKRAIDTWIYSLWGNDADEQTDYKHTVDLSGCESECDDAVEELHRVLQLPQQRRQRELRSHPDSLSDGVSEAEIRLP